VDLNTSECLTIMAHPETLHILAVLVTPGEVMDNHPMLDLKYLELEIQFPLDLHKQANYHY